MTGPTRFPVIGLGAVASVGRGAPEIYARLCAGATGLAPMRGFNRDWYTASQLYEIDNRGGAGDVPKRATAFLVDALGQALADAGITEDLGDIPVLIGTGLREHRSVELWWRDRAAGQAAPTVRIGPADLHFGTELRRRFGAVDTHTFANACSASLYALALGTDLLACGAAETVIVGAADSITESMFGLSDRVQSDPPDAVRPFDVNRRGTILGEGAAVVVLRREPRVCDRVYGWVRGVAINCDAFHATAPDPENIAFAIRDAHRRGGVSAADIDLVMLHGTGTYANDQAEAAAIRVAFGANRKTPVMTAVKSLIGHTSGASGLHSLVTALYSMREGWVPATATLTEPIESAADFRIARGLGVPGQASLAQVHAFGFGGVNGVAILERDGGGQPARATTVERRRSPATVITGVGLALPGGARSVLDLAATQVDRAERVDPVARIGRKGLRYKDWATQLGLVAAADALHQAGLVTGTGLAVSLTVPAPEVAVVASSNFGNLDSVTAVVTAIANDGGTRLLSPMLGPSLSSNIIGSEVAIRFGLRGPNLMVCGGATGGLDAMRWAVSLLDSGRAHQVLVLGVEPDNEVVRALVGHDNVFDGAVALVVEHANTARERAVRAQARLGRSVRTGDLASCVAALAADEPGATGWYCPDGLGGPEEILSGLSRHDLGRVWGTGSGATGVLQCAAAVGRFVAGGGGPMYAVAGADHGCAGLVLWPGDE